MSESDSFINEVTDEVRRDALYGYLRRYGWIAVLVVIGLVGGAAFNEYSKAQSQSAAQLIGDQMLDALSNESSDDRAKALAEIDAVGASQAVASLLTAATQLEAGKVDAAARTLGGLAANTDIPEIYRNLAALKAAMLPTDDISDRMNMLEILAQPGASFALLAREQIGLMQVETGDSEAAIITMRLISEDAGVTRGLRERAQKLIVGLGGAITASVPAQ